MANSCVTCCICCLTKSGSLCCGIFSIVGAIFLTSLGLLLQFQGEYIHIPVEYEEGDDFHHEIDTARTNAYSGAITYVVVMALCAGSYLFHSKKEVESKDLKGEKPTLTDLPNLSFLGMGSEINGNGKKVHVS
eukprot:maker-scaffold_3-snap-gene-9.42-mRNA-1 protein AED:0.00 eAED:0.00 QI:140/1/1/1/1/1/3/55/132